MTEHRYFATGGLSTEAANVFGERIEQIAERNGLATPAAIVEDAEDVSSPIHDFFEWNDEVAGHRYRLNQAHFYLRHIVVVPAEKKAPVRAFHSVKITTDENEQRGYAPLARILSDEGLLNQVIESAQRELQSWRRRYGQYKALARATEKVEEALTVFEA